MSPELQKILEYAAYGAVAALVGAMSKSRTLSLPRIVIQRESDGEVRKWIDTGFLSAPFLGAVLAAYFDTSPQNAIAWGLAAGFAGPSIVNAIVDGLLKKFGVQIGGLPETAVPTTNTGGQ